ncbi:MAG: serine--tRNA ligase [Chitinophagaceae bacterium]
MLQVSLLKQQPDWVKERLTVKNFKQIALVDTIIALDDERRKIQVNYDSEQAIINAASKEIGKLMAQGLKEEAEHKKQTVAEAKKNVAIYAQQLAEKEQQVQEALVQLPNLPANEVPKGYGADDNEVVLQTTEMPLLPENAKEHWHLLDQFQLVNFELGNKITGSGFPVYIGKGAKLQRALVQYFLDFNTAAGYLEYLPPFMVNEASAYGTGQLPDKEGQMYYVTEDKLYLIPTAEVPVTNVYRDVILKEEQLPLKMTAYSPCFRREAGSYGKDVRGLNRVHQFEKVEIIQIVHPNNSYQVLDEMIAHVEKLLQSLNLPYRILRLCGGDMSFASAITYDFEVFSAAQQKWLEVSSVSNFEAFQTNRLKCRFKDANGKTQLAHSLNGSSLALPRIMACILENNQTTDGINMPKVLIPYVGFDKIE